MTQVDNYINEVNDYTYVLLCLYVRLFYILLSMFQHSQFMKRHNNKNY